MPVCHFLYATFHGSQIPSFQNTVVVHITFAVLSWFSHNQVHMLVWSIRTVKCPLQTVHFMSRKCKPHSLEPHYWMVVAACWISKLIFQCLDSDCHWSMKGVFGQCFALMLNANVCSCVRWQTMFWPRSDVFPLEFFNVTCQVSYKLSTL